MADLIKGFRGRGGQKKFTCRRRGVELVLNSGGVKSTHSVSWEVALNWGELFSSLKIKVRGVMEEEKGKEALKLGVWWGRVVEDEEEEDPGFGFRRGLMEVEEILELGYCSGAMEEGEEVEEVVVSLRLVWCWLISRVPMRSPRRILSWFLQGGSDGPWFLGRTRGRGRGDDVGGVRGEARGEVGGEGPGSGGRVVGEETVDV